MLQLPNNSSHLPVSSTRLNFYLAQCKLKQNKHPQLPNAHGNNTGIKRIPNSRLENNIPKPYTINLRNILDRRPSKQSNDIQEQEGMSNMFGNESFVSVNACQNSIHLSPSRRPAGSTNHRNDALDELMTDRQNYKIQIKNNSNQRQTDRGYCNNDKSVRFRDNQLLNCYSAHKIDYLPPIIQRQIRLNAHGGELSNNKSDLICHEQQKNQNYQNYGIDLGPRVLSTRQNIIYFNHHKNQNQEKAQKKVNWRAQPKKIDKKNVYYFKMDSDFKQISNQLSRLTYELNSNSKKLDEMNKAYIAIKTATKSSPQESLKRANLKYSTIDIEKANQGYGLNHRPLVQYEDKFYRDPRYLIWQPLHYKNSHIKIT